MFRLPWNPAWMTKGASLWSIASKIGYACGVSSGDILRAMLGADFDRRLPIWTPKRSVAIAVARHLELQSPDGLFLADFSRDFHQRENINLAVRWCPECLRGWHHTVRFQDVRIRRCPWHDAPLLEVCPRCARAVDPLGPPFRCQACGLSLAPEPLDWLTDFKRAPDHEGMWPSSLESRQLFHADEAESSKVSCYIDDSDSAAPAAHPRAFEHWEVSRLFESNCSLWDSLLADHRGCLARESVGWAPQYYQHEFACPIVAAATVVFGTTSAFSEEQGTWPNRLTAIPQIHSSLPDVGLHHQNVRRLLLRQLPRVWLRDALLLFGDVARMGRSHARWEIRDIFKAEVDIPEGSKVASVLVTNAQHGDLLQAKQYAEKYCLHGGSG